MAVMRVERNSNYTVMANYHLRDKQLSLKAKGLLSVMLSLPVEWDYTMAGLAFISKEGIDAIRAAIKELEQTGYIIRSRRRNEAGQLADTEYTIYESPQKNEEALLDDHNMPACSTPPSPISEKPILENPTLDLPTLGKPILENPIQLNKEERNKDKSKNDSSNPYPSSIHPSIYEEKESVEYDLASRSSYHCPSEQKATSVKPNHQEQLTASQSTINTVLRRRLTFDDLVHKIKKQIDYWDLIHENNKDEIDNILSIIVEIMSTKCEYFTISGKQYPSDLVHQRFSQINANTIEYVLECLHKCGSDIRNIKQYLVAALFNAPATYDSYYNAAVRRDFEYLRQ